MTPRERTVNALSNLYVRHGSIYDPHPPNLTKFPKVVGAVEEAIAAAEHEARQKAIEECAQWHDARAVDFEKAMKSEEEAEQKLSNRLATLYGEAVREKVTGFRKNIFEELARKEKYAAEQLRALARDGKEGG